MNIPISETNLITSLISFKFEDDAWEIDSRISIEIDSQSPLVDMKMEYKHGDSEIQKMQIMFAHCASLVTLLPLRLRASISILA